MVIPTGWTQKVVPRPLRPSARQVMDEARCTSFHMPDIIVSFLLFVAYFSPADIMSTVYLDNPKATNDLLIKELDRDLRA